ncbi:MAG: LidA [Legionella longbeachae]|nr:LidA [Legionella longbeachae]
MLKNSTKPLSLTSAQLEQWFASTERYNNPSKSTASSLSTEFLSRFGLKDPSEVIEFLKSADGKRTLSLIRQELDKIESLNQYKEKQYRELALIIERRAIYILMASIAKEMAHAKKVSENTQQQIEKKLKETKHGAEDINARTVALDVLQKNINAYTKAIQALDEHINEEELNLLEVEKILENLAEEVQQMEDLHEHINAHLDQLHAYLDIPLLNQPIAHYITHANQQITSLTTQLTALRSQAAPQNTGAVIIEQPHEPQKNKKIKMIEEQLEFHKNQIKQQPKNGEDVIQQLIQQAQNYIHEKQCQFENQSPPLQHQYEMEGMKMQIKGLQQFCHVFRNEKILLNSQLEQVYDFKHAHLIIDPSHKSRYQKYNNSYVFLPEHVNHSQLTEKDWLQARLNYDRLKPKVQVAHVHHKEKMQQQKNNLNKRVQHYKDQHNELIDQIDAMKECKVGLLHALSDFKTQRQLLSQNPKASPFIMSPKPPQVQRDNKTKTLSLVPGLKSSFTPVPKPKSSYALMMKSLECLVPKHAPAPRKEDIHQVKSILNSIVPPERKEELNQLIEEVRPGEIMSPKIRLGWLYRAKKLIPDENIISPAMNSNLEPKI